MISVLIVDDEYLIRSLIRNSVPWVELGLRVVGEAEDGEEALGMIEALQPQIALVDINMPVLNGLELAQQIQARNCPTRVVFLTGYRDFEYAKQAVTYRAFDYLLKPISTEELADTLIRLAREIERERQVSAYMRTVEQESDKGKRLLKEHFLHRLAFGRLRLSDRQLQEELARLEITLAPERLLAMAVEIEPAEGDRDDGLYVYAVLNILLELLAAEQVFLNLEGISEIDSCAIVLCNAEAGCRGLPQRIRRCWESLHGSVEQYFSFGLSGGVQGPVQGYGKIPTAVQAALEALSGRFYEADGGLFFAGEALPGLPPPSMPSVNLDELQLCIDSGEQAEGRAVIHEAFQRMRRERAPERMTKMTALVVLAVFYALSAKYNLPQEIMTVEGCPVLERIEKSGSCAEVERLTLDCYNRLMDSLLAARKVSKIVFTAQAYIKANYASSGLSLKNVAAAVFAAPSYVSSLFKKETGVSVTEYIALCRMKKAAELMNTAPEMSLLAVSERVGYTDPYYFSRCFKKYYGVTPSKFLFSHTAWTGSGQEASPSEQP